MTTTEHLKTKNIVAIATVTNQTGYDSSHVFRHILPVTVATTVGELIQWANKRHILNLVSLEIQNTEETL